MGHLFTAYGHIVGYLKQNRSLDRTNMFKTEYFSNNSFENNTTTI